MIWFLNKSKGYLIFLILLSFHTSVFPQVNDPDRRSGYQGLVELGYAVGKEYEYRTDFIKLNLTARYAFNPFLTAGLGGGIRLYYDETDFMIPLYVSFQTNLPGYHKVTPFLALSAGYLFDVTTEYTVSGIVPMFNPAAGIYFHLPGKNAIMLGLGYEMHRATVFDDWLDEAHPTYLSYFNLNMCFLFQNLKLFTGKSHNTE